MRVTGGRLKGRRLATARSSAIRPTTDRVRGAVFDILTQGMAIDIEGLRVLDLFAGSGSLGIEALSRGARFCLAVERSATARGIIRENIEHLKLNGVMRVFRRDATRLGHIGSLQPFDLVFLDPPYGQGLEKPALKAARQGGWLAPNALCVLESSAKDEPALFSKMEIINTRVYGDTRISFIR